MPKTENKKAQAAVELAVFGAILIFLLGTIVRTAAGNGYTQDQDFKAMRMAMLASWNGSKAGNTARNSASVLFVEDRLSPDFNKYGDLDRNPFVANGSGTFTFEMLYPLDPYEVSSNLPIMDVYINGQHFPFTTASYVQDWPLTQSSCGPGPGVPPSVAQANCLATCAAASPTETTTQIAQTSCVQQCQQAADTQCLQNQCYRNYREWVGGNVQEPEFDGIVNPPVAVAGCPITTASSPTDLEIECDAWDIFNTLAQEGVLTFVSGTDPVAQGHVASATLPNTFTAWFQNTFSGTGSQINRIQNILQADSSKYKLFYSMVPNGTNEFSPTPPACTSINTSGCKDLALSSTLTLPDAYNTPYTNTQGYMQYDLLRLGYYTTAASTASCTSSLCNSVKNQFPAGPTACQEPNTVASSTVSSMRCDISWQWSATAGTNATQIGLNPPNQYPMYDINGSLKEQTIYAISQNSSGVVSVSYEDAQHGDIDSTWDSNSCTPKPGLQSESQIFTFTSPTCTNGLACPSSGVCANGAACGSTYLQIKEGQLFNPETGQVVRSANKRDSIDLIQRIVQLSNNTERFCSGISSPRVQSCIASCSLISCADNQGSNCNCTPSAANNYCNCDLTNSNPSFTPVTCNGGDPNPVEACVDGVTSNCFSSDNIAKTCFDTSDNLLYVRSRIEDRRGHFWVTNASGQLKVQ